MSANIQTASAKNNTYRTLIEKLFLTADIRIDGDRPHDITVHNEDFYRRVLRDGQLGMGESYMEGWWDCDAVDEMSTRFIRAKLHKDSYVDLRFLLYFLKVRLSGIGRKSKAYEVGRRHYDLGNDLFANMLDSRMIYSCAYWKGANSLDQAQENKLDIVCRKLGLQPGMRVLEIGCGWGGWARYAAETYGVEVVGVTVSKEQKAFADRYCSGLPIEIRLEDYRQAREQFDRVVSIAMFEAVGHKYFRTFMEVADRCLKDDGLFLLHSIVGNEPIGAAQSRWLNEYIFPNGELPSLAQITKSVEGLFIVEAAHRFGDDYERTLQVWHENFVRNWTNIRDSYDQRFFRMWTLYLLISQGIFRSRIAHVWQFVFAKEGYLGTAQEMERRREFCEAR